MYKVYLHTSPNGKYYVGQTRNPLLRWSNGISYKSNRAFYHDIQEYGWENIKHEILYECETRSEAEAYERMFIVLLDSENADVGYNNTKICYDLRKLLSQRHAYVPTRNEENEVKYIDNSEESNPFFSKDIPTSEASRIIDEWIYNKRHRQMAKDRYVDGDDFSTIAKRYGLSVRQTKRIIYDCKSMIEQHI